MKKLITVFIVAAIAIGALLTVLILKVNDFRKSNDKSTSKIRYPSLPADGITLNGEKIADPNVMVTNFYNDNRSSHNLTSVWLKDTWVKNVRDIAKSEGGDGIRIYFAKRKDNKYNSVVIVSTYFTGVDNNAETHADHQDYFIHSDPFFKSKDALLKEDWSGEPGTTLFDENPPCIGEDCGVFSSNDIKCTDASAAVLRFKYAQPKQPIYTYCEWFPLTMLDLILEDLTGQTTANPKEPSNGIRIYFARHTNTSSHNHPNRYAFIITTTKAKKI